MIICKLIYIYIKKKWLVDFVVGDQSTMRLSLFSSSKVI